MIDDEPPDESKLRLVASNDAAEIAERQRILDAHLARDMISEALGQFLSSALRILAGAGDGYETTRQFLKICDLLKKATDAGHLVFLPGLDTLTIDKLFPDESSEYFRSDFLNDEFMREKLERQLTVRRLRQHFLREVASALSKSNLQLRREQREIDEAIDYIVNAREKKRTRVTAPLQKQPPHRSQPAQASKISTAFKKTTKEIPVGKEISEPSTDLIERPPMKQEEVLDPEQILALLRPHHWKALLAVHTAEEIAFNQVDAFAFQLVANMGLLKRKVGGKKTKRAWELTDLGKSIVSQSP